MLLWTLGVLLTLLDLFMASLTLRFVSGKNSDFVGFLLCAFCWPAFLVIHWGFTLGDRLNNKKSA